MLDMPPSDDTVAVEPIHAPKGWGTHLIAAICESCDWGYLLPPDSLPLTCPHCFKTDLTPLSEAEALPGAHSPELQLPFTVTSGTVARQVETFAKSIWFAPADLTLQNLQRRLQPIYLPMWLVDSDVQAIWQAEAGFDYEAISHRESYDQNQGRWNSQRITETRIRWEPRMGRLSRPYANIAAPALEEQTDLQNRLGAYELGNAQPYQPQTISEALIRLPNRPPDDAWPDALPGLQAEAAEECRHACQAQHIREFRWQADYHNQHWTLLLLPLYTTYYLDDTQVAQPVLIHGQSGHLDGPRRASMRRARRITFIIAGLAVMIFAASVVLAVLALAVRQLLTLATLGVLLAMFVGLVALVPVGLAWQFNRSQP